MRRVTDEEPAPRSHLCSATCRRGLGRLPTRVVLASCDGRSEAARSQDADGGEAKWHVYVRGAARRLDVSTHDGRPSMALRNPLQQVARMMEPNSSALRKSVPARPLTGARDRSRCAVGRTRRYEPSRRSVRGVHGGRGNRLVTGGEGYGSGLVGSGHGLRRGGPAVRRRSATRTGPVRPGAAACRDRGGRAVRSCTGARRSCRLRWMLSRWITYAPDAMRTTKATAVRNTYMETTSHTDDQTTGPTGRPGLLRNGRGDR